MPNRELTVEANLVKRGCTAQSARSRILVHIIAEWVPGDAGRILCGAERLPRRSSALLGVCPASLCSRLPPASVFPRAAKHFMLAFACRTTLTMARNSNSPTPSSMLQ